MHILLVNTNAKRIGIKEKKMENKRSLSPVYGHVFDFFPAVGRNLHFTFFPDLLLRARYGIVLFSY